MIIKPKLMADFKKQQFWWRKSESSLIASCVEIKVRRAKVRRDKSASRDPFYHPILQFNISL